jgi:hypothetical protein
MSDTHITPIATVPARRRGRPPGSRNKPKPLDQQPAIKPAAMRVGCSGGLSRRLGHHHPPANQAR